jgi:hypothetical protein
MRLLRLAYIALFLVALIAVFVCWSQIGWQGHLDMLPWHVKLFLGVASAFACTKAAAAAVEGAKAWNRGTIAWSGVLLALLIACGLAAYWAHVYLEDDESYDEGDESAPASIAPVALHAPALPGFLPSRRPV